MIKTCVSVTNDTLSIDCVLYNKYGCISCDIGYYLSNTKCRQCSENRANCICFETKCLSYKYGYYQGDNYTCFLSTELLKKSATNNHKLRVGVINAKTGITELERNCYDCLLNCSTCNTKDTCLTCNLTNYKTQSGNCLPQNSVIGCAVEVTQNGCSKCQDGYYTVNYNECKRCHDNCTTCTHPKNAHPVLKTKYYLKVDFAMIFHMYYSVLKFQTQNAPNAHFGTLQMIMGLCVTNMWFGGYFSFLFCLPFLC
ncbi:hypothetical protein EIN_204440 [Entamoeba invadens IP1]|uniref:Uncharacterized protein n=1 Tax=Entamoeba invadens IP1 TaxID=370355 RepID=L7FML7_ENTIV|nr:hypothetical protein EIN_204440 [Entamoeba invadens IP1]ELP89109.1 hypothetical protein EIN_204440 [Entamoeba invadens IP1]|eukprot:XP_004255880.1 hypothetical protein EIN_204440 [Entamoeba invadens IP1]